MLMRTTKRRLVAIALIGVLALGACGNDASDSSASFCHAATSYQAASSAVAFSAANPAELEATFTQLQHSLDGLQSAAPSEINADVDTVTKVIGDRISALAEVEYDYSKMVNDPAGQAATQAPPPNEFDTASRNVNNYIASQCHTSTDEPGPVPAEMCPKEAWPVAAAYELETGNFQWATCTPEGGLFLPAAASEDTVWVVGGQPEYRAFDAASGKELWRGDQTRFVSEVPADADRPVETPPVIDGVQLTGGQDDPMVGVDAATSETLWTQPGHLVYDDVWAVGDGAVFAMETLLGDGSPKPPALVGYEVATGDVRWRRETTFTGPGPWHVSGERLLAMWYSLQVLATDDGSVLWEIGYPEPSGGFPRLMGGLANSQSVFVTFTSEASGGD